MLSNSSKVTRNFKVLKLLFSIFIFCRSTVNALFEGCDHSYQLNPGYAYVESPYYPNYYPPGTSCRYNLVAPLDHIIIASCTLNLNKGSNGCTTEFFYLARDGDVLLRDSEQLCGYGTFIRQSEFRSLVLAYVSRGSRGVFRCQLRVVAQACDCGWSVSTKIVNGQETFINEFPSMVVLKDRTTNQPFYCAGSIISHRFIVTAAHCTRIQPNPPSIEARVGIHNIEASTPTKYFAVYFILQIIEHPSYTAEPVRNDIALLLTRNNIEWSKGVGPICLPRATSVNNNFNYYTVDVVGWGTTSFAGPTSRTLQKVNLMITDFQTCARAYDNVTTVYPSQICTYDNMGTGKDSCQFDSGGPVVLKNSRLVLLGIISFGKGCGQGGYAIGINTRVTSYLNWINYNTGYSTCNASTI